MSKYFQYFVEGKCEEKLINALKTPPCNYLISGRVDVFNVIQNKLSKQRILSIHPHAMIIIVYDIDVKDDSKLIENIKVLKLILEFMNNLKLLYKKYYLINKAK